MRSVRDVPVASLIQDGSAAAVGGEQCLDPGTELGVTAALALQVGGPLGRVFFFESLGEDVHQLRVVFGHRFISWEGVSL